ncbi:MAG: DNA repair protein RecO [Bacteroidales bacterium]|nr:DNA repair protein RecO [Bacteroidales bacterium]
MLHSTKGIVFHSLKYSDTSVIVKIYTELFGIQSYLLKGIRSPGSKIKPGLFQSLTLLDLVVYHKEKRSLQMVKEVRLAHVFKTIPQDIRKSSLVLFINELVYKSIREEEPNPELFAFLWKTCRQLDETTESVSCFHIHFAIGLCRHLGIFPQTNYSEKKQIFNLREGLFQSHIPEHPHYLDPGNSLLFYSLLKTCNQHFTAAQNFTPLLETILLYYKLHLPGFRDVQSHHILHDALA